MNYSKLIELSRPFSAYEDLSGGVNAWGLGGMGVVKRGGFGSSGLLGSVPGWVRSGAVIDEDFFNQRAWPRPFATEMVDTRASSQFVPNAAMVWISASSGVLPISTSYMEVEASSTNVIRTNDFTGLIPGVIGSGGSFGSNKGAPFVTGGVTGLTLNVLGTGSENGLTYGEIRISGTPSGNGNVQIFGETSNGIAASTGQVWAHSAFLRVSAGALTNIGSWFISLNENTGAGVFVAANNTAVTAPTSTMARVSQVRTLSGGGTVGATQPYFQFAVTTGNAIDITIRVYQEKVEATSVSSPITTSGASASRAANAITLQRTGIGRVVFTFDDDSTQTISGITLGSQYTLPTNLTRPLLKRLTGYAA